MTKFGALLISIVGSILTVSSFNTTNIWVQALLFVLFALAYLLAQVILFFVVLGIIALPINTKKEVKHFNKKYHKIYVFYTRLLLSLFSVKVEIDGLENIPQDETFVLVHNHLSNLDPIIINAKMGKYKMNFMAKKSISKVPFFGKIVTKTGFLFLERDGIPKDAYAIAKAIRMLKNNECSIVVAPEGTRNFTDQVLLPFKQGSFLVASKAKKSIVVCVFEGTNEIKNNVLFKRHIVKMHLCNVISKEEVLSSTQEEISDKVYQIMYDTLTHKK